MVRSGQDPWRVVPAPRASARRAADPVRSARWALRVLQVGGIACVLAALPYRLFELERHMVPKELVLHLVALGGGLLCLASARRFTIFAVDLLLAGFLALSALSALLAVNGWLASRALAVSLAGAAIFWTARTVTRAGHGRPLLAALAAAVVVGAITALVQAYGVLASPLFNPVRAPGGTFGNRNFVAHLVAIGLPTLLLVALEARRRSHFALAAVGLTLAVGALFLSRSRAGWLGAGVSGIFLLVEGLWIGRLWRDVRLRRRALALGAAAAIGVVAALALPNRLNWRSESPYLDSITGMANYKEGSGRGRLIQYGNSLRMGAAHPLLGVGPGNWPVHYPRFRSPGDPSYDANDIIPTNPWPSSDWMAMASERGFPTTLLLVLVGAALGLGAWARLRRGGRAPALSDLAIVATLLAVGVVGAFDAVLLLPVPTFFAWGILGALASSARPVREIALTPERRRRLAIAVATLGAVFVARTAAQIAAMSLYSRPGRASMETAARVDPGSYRIRMLLGLQQLAEGRCTDARRHAEAARDLFPHHPAPERLLRACGGRRAR